jgi:hypothetical protein
LNSRLVLLVKIEKSSQIIIDDICFLFYVIFRVCAYYSLRPAAFGDLAFAGFVYFLRASFVVAGPAVDGFPAGDGFHRFLWSLLQRSVADSQLAFLILLTSLL